MQKWLTTTLAVFSLLLIVINLQFLSTGSSASQRTVNQTVEEARTKLNQTFNATVTAEQAGADVNEVVKQLNHALNYTVQAETALSRGDSEQATFLAESAIQLCNEVLSQVENLRAQAETGRLVGLITPIAAAIALVFVGGIIFFYGRRFLAGRREE
jgi:nucleotidyltransferase/DNA polymerase involved in DNA repair